MKRRNFYALLCPRGGDTRPYLKDLSTVGGRAGKRKRLSAAIGAFLLAGAFSVVPPAAFAHPILDAKDAAVSISGTTNMAITSGAPNNLIKWVDFSIGSGESVTFDANNYLNYVTGSARSEILGALTGGGSIYLVNPNGILIGDGATVNVGNLHLSTKALTAAQLADYATATSALSSANIGTGDVINLGNLNANVISVEGNNITFKNVADVKNGSAANVTLTAKSGGEIHIGSETGGASGYTTNGTTYNYKLVHDATELQDMTSNGNYMLANDIPNVTFEPDKVINNYTGRFDGLNYKLSSLTIKLGNYGYGGLFRMNDGMIENLEISGITFTDAVGEWNPNAIGAVVGYNHSGTIKNVRTTGSMTIDIDRTVNNIGGIAGINDGTIENVSNSANISYGKVTQNLGGISGYNYGEIVNASNSGTITGSDSPTLTVGGIVGSNYNGGTIEGASNSGAIISTTSDAVGGIAGSNAGTMQSTENTGTVNDVVPDTTPTPTSTQELPTTLETMLGGGSAAKEYTGAVTAMERESKQEASAALPQERLAAGATTAHITIENGGTNTPPNMDVAAALAAAAVAEHTDASAEEEEEEA